MWGDQAAELYFDSRFEGMRDVRHGEALNAARAAIAEMREPTEGMWLAADAQSRGGLATAGETWHAMIDAALKESHPASVNR
jgi:hypothetical protein